MQNWSAGDFRSRTEGAGSLRERVFAVLGVPVRKNQTGALN